MDISSSRVLVAGAGVSGAGCVEALTAVGAHVWIADSNLDAAHKLERFGAHALSAQDVDFADLAVDLVVTSPGWRPDSPLLVAAQSAGIEVIGDVELAYHLDRAGVFGPPRTWMAVTGTNGKTTTTGMLASIMQVHGQATEQRVSAVGNIGTSLFSALAAQPRIDILVAELSSFQLHWAPTLVPDIGVLLNLADDHLDWHGGFDAYGQAKAAVLRAPLSVIGADDEHVVSLAQQYGESSADSEHPSKQVSFSHLAPKPQGIGVIDGRIVASDSTGQNTDICSAEGLQPAGLAGVLDACAAAAAAYSFGVPPEAIAKGLSSYRVAKHRGAIVHSGGGVNYIDNSKATNPHAAAAAMAGLDSVVWIAGGQLKGASVDELIREEGSRLKAAVLIGVDRRLIALALGRHAPAVPVTVIDDTDPEVAMQRAVAAAHNLAQPGDSVLLAPAAASLDMFSGMAQRGDLFAHAAAHYAT